MEAVAKVQVKKHPAYKDSGAEWLGDVPDHWHCLKMKFLFKDVSIKNRPNAELLSVTQDQGVVPRSMVENRMVMPTTGLDSFKFISKGDFAISLRSFEGGLEYCYHDGIISPAYTVLKSQKEIQSSYYKHLFKSKAFISELQTSVVGIREGKNISYAELCTSILPIPPLSEQTAIASFLDRKCALIDKAIAIKEKQIALLKERRQILIQNAVTRGLNPNVKMKDSGVDWIGEIPEHWEVTSVKHVLNMPICDGPHTTPQLYEDGYPFVSAEAIKNGEIDFQKIRGYISLKDYLQFSKKYLPKRNDIFMVKSGATTGNVAMVRTDIEFSIWSPLAVFRANPQKVIPNYLLNYLESPSFRLGVELSWSFGTQQNIGMGILSNLPIVYPSIQEQIMISEYIIQITNNIISAVSLKEQEIEKLKEYKTCLINEAVTGKIKVC
jgi:type I restriction enzyme S subunit